MFICLHTYANNYNYWEKDVKILTWLEFIMSYHYQVFSIDNEIRYLALQKVTELITIPFVKL